jgi:Recombination endonuclease VII
MGADGKVCEGPDCDVELPPRLARDIKRFCSSRCKTRALTARLAAERTERRCSVCKMVKPITEFYNARQSACKECEKAKRRAAYKASNGNGREIVYNNNLRRRYGITLTEYKAMVAAQDGCCAICGERSEARMHVDHDHATGVIRQLLCPPCNAALGGARDRPDLLRAMAGYLERHQAVAEGS